MMSPPGDPYVLLVDDDLDIRESIQTLLELEGYHTVTLADGAAALEWLRSDVAPPRLILLDLMMPGMNGIEFRAAQLHDPRLAALPVVILSGAGEVADEQAGVLRAELLKKPFELKTLLATVMRYWPRAEQGSEDRAK